MSVPKVQFRCPQLGCDYDRLVTRKAAQTHWIGHNNVISSFPLPSRQGCQEKFFFRCPIAGCAFAQVTLRHIAKRHWRTHDGTDENFPSLLLESVPTASASVDAPSSTVATHSPIHAVKCESPQPETPSSPTPSFTIGSVKRSRPTINPPANLPPAIPPSTIPPSTIAPPASPTPIILHFHFHLHLHAAQSRTPPDTPESEEVDWLMPSTPNSTA